MIGRVSKTQPALKSVGASKNAPVVKIVGVSTSALAVDWSALAVD